MDEAKAREALVRLLRFESTDRDPSEEIYHDDAILEFPQSGERFVGRHNFTEWRRLYPGDVQVRIRRMINRGDLWVVELLASYDGGQPMFGVSMHEFRGDRIAREIIYVMEGFEPAEWRTPWMTQFDRFASTAPSEWRPGMPFGLESVAPSGEAREAIGGLSRDQ